ncbi:hypothetical protein ACFONC_13205 [Luteimonas soli]|uniref:HEPN domain-containing protein n=1 Tax=Luteimonas soli TaxID=1648966 RepID=A0ABV7XQ35_9GAMM
MIDPSALIAFAEQQQLNPGAARRAAISRAYYAAFHALQDCIRPMIAAGDCGAHGCVKHAKVLHSLRYWVDIHPNQQKAMQHGADAIKAWHSISAVKEARERADYLLGSGGEFTPKQAVDFVGKAKRVVSLARKMSQ